MNVFDRVKSTTMAETMNLDFTDMNLHLLITITQQNNVIHRLLYKVNHFYIFCVFINTVVPKLCLQCLPFVQTPDILSQIQVQYWNYSGKYTKLLIIL